jgi:hypothetical protein
MQAFADQCNDQVVEVQEVSEVRFFTVTSPMIFFMRDNLGRRLNNDAYTALALYILQLLWEPYSDGINIPTKVMAEALKEFNRSTCASSVTMVMAAYLISKIDETDWSFFMANTMAVVPKDQASNCPDILLPFRIIFASIMLLMGMVECHWDDDRCRLHNANCKKLSFWMKIGTKFFSDKTELANLIFFLMNHYESTTPVTLEDLEYFTETALVSEGFTIKRICLEGCHLLA